MRVLDAGCGEGRNLPYFVKNGFDVWGVDANPAALRLLRLLGKSWGPAFDPEKFIESPIDELPLPPARFDAVVCCAVLHFAHDESHFFRMIDELLRVLKPSGSLFVRMNSQGASKGHLSAQKPPFFLLTPALSEQLLTRYPLRWREPPCTVHREGEVAQSILILEKE